MGDLHFAVTQELRYFEGGHGLDVARLRAEVIRDEAALEAQALQNKEEVAKLMAEIALLRCQLEGAGIIPETRTGEEYLRMYRQAAQVVRVAQLALLELGTSKEMLAVFS
jgi:hypothetical protein